MGQEDRAALQKDLQRWARLLRKQPDPRVRKVLKELIKEARAQLQGRAPPAQKRREER